MADHILSIVSVTPRQPPAGYAVGDKVTVKLKVDKPVGLTRGKAQATVSCPLWDRDHVVAIQGEESFTRTLTTAGQGTITIKDFAGSCTNTAPITQAIKVNAGAKVSFATPAFDPAGKANVPGAPPNGYKLGPVTAKLQVVGAPHEKGSSVTLSSPAMKRDVKVALTTGVVDAPIELVFQEADRDVEITLTAERCETDSPAQASVRVVAPVASVVAVDATTEHAAGTTAKVKVTFTYAPPAACVVKLRGEVVKAGKHEVSLKKNVKELEVDVPLAKELTAAGTFDIVMEKVSGDFSIDLQKNTARIKAAPPMQVSFPKTGFTVPDAPKGFYTTEECDVIVRLNRAAPQGGVTVNVKLSTGPETYPVTIAEGSQEGRTDPAKKVKYLKEDLKTKLQLDVGTSTAVIVGDPGEHTLKVHKLNRVLFGKKVEPKGPYHPGQTIKVPVRLKYPLRLTDDQKAGGKTSILIGTLKAAAAKSTTTPAPTCLAADLPIEMEDGATERVVELTLAETTTADTYDLQLFAEQANGFRAETAGGVGKKDLDHARTSIVVEAVRPIELVGRPFLKLASGSELAVEHFVAGETAHVRFRTTTGTSTEVDAGTLELSLAGTTWTKSVPIRMPAQTTPSTDGTAQPCDGVASFVVERPTTTPAGPADLTIKLTPNGAFAVQKRKVATITTQARALPKLAFATDPVVLPTGQLAAKEGTAYLFADREQATLRVELEAGARPPQDGFDAKVEGDALAGPVALTSIDAEQWSRLGVTRQDVVVTFAKKTPAALAPVVQLTATKGCTVATAPLNPPPQQPGTAPAATGKLTVKLSEQPRLGLACVVKRGATPPTPREPEPKEQFALNDEVDVVLSLFGGKPGYPWKGELRCAAFKDAVAVDLTTITDTEWASGEKVLPATFDVGAGELTQLRLLSQWTAEREEYDKKYPPLQPGQTRNPPAPPFASQLTDKEPLALTARVTVQPGTIPVKLKKTANVQLEAHDTKWFVDGGTPSDDGKAAPSFTAGDRVKLKLSLSEPLPVTWDPKCPIVRLQSLAFPPPPTAPKPLPGAQPVPGFYDVKVEPDPNAPDKVLFEAEFPVLKSPATTVDWDVSLVDAPKSPYLPVVGDLSKFRLRVRPLPKVGFQVEQPAFVSMTEGTVPPGSPPGTVAGANTYNTVVGATVALSLVLDAPPPAAGATFNLAWFPDTLVQDCPDGTEVMPPPPPPPTNPPTPSPPYTTPQPRRFSITVPLADYQAGKRKDDGRYVHRVHIVVNKVGVGTAAPALPLNSPTTHTTERAAMPPWNSLRLEQVKNEDGAPSGAVVDTLAATMKLGTSGVSLTFPIDGWWIKPVKWKPDGAGVKDPAQRAVGWVPEWTPAQTEALRNGLPFAKGDFVHVRVQRHGGHPVATPETGKSPMTAAALAKVTSFAFGTEPPTSDDPLVDPPLNRKAVAVEVRWEQDEELSVPVLVRLNPPHDWQTLAGVKPHESILAQIKPPLQPVAITRFPTIPVTIEPVRGAVVPPQTIGTPVWGAAAPGHGRGLRVADAREVRFDPAWHERKHKLHVGDLLPCEVAVTAFLQGALKLRVRGMPLLTSDGTGVDYHEFQLEPGVMIGNVDVKVLHPMEEKPGLLEKVGKLLDKKDPNAPPPPQTTPPDQEPEPEEYVFLEIVQDSGNFAVTSHLPAPDKDIRGKLSHMKKGMTKEGKKKLALPPCAVRVIVSLPSVSFDEKEPILDPPAKQPKKKSKGKKIAGCFGKGDKAKLNLWLDHPPPAGAKVMLVSPVIGEGWKSIVSVPWPEGQTRLEHEVSFPVSFPGPQRIDVKGIGLSGFTTGEDHLWVLVDQLPGVSFLPVDLTPNSTAKTWASPAGPYAYNDEVTLRACLSEPAGEGGAKVNVTCDAFDRAFPLDFAEGESEAEVKVQLAKKVDKTKQYVVLEPVSGCVKGASAARQLDVLFERTAYFPPRICIAPAGPFVKDDAATISVMLSPHAPPGGAKVKVTGPFKAEPEVVFDEGEVFKAVEVEFARESEAPQAVSIAPVERCTHGRFASFPVTVYTPKVQFNPQPLDPNESAKLGEDTTVIVILDKPAPGPKGASLTELEQKREEAKQQGTTGSTGTSTTTTGTEKKKKKKKDADIPSWGASVDVSSPAFVHGPDGKPKVYKAKFIPGATVALVGVTFSKDEALAGEQDLTLSAEDRCVLGDRKTVKVKVRKNPWVCFASPGIVAGPGVRVEGDEARFKVGDTATLRLTLEEPTTTGDVRIRIKSPAFGPKVYTAVFPRPAKQGQGLHGPGKQQETAVAPVIEVAVTFAAGSPDAGGGTPKEKLKITLDPPPGWRAATPQEGGGSELLVSVLAPTVSQTCPLKRKEQDENAPPQQDDGLVRDEKPHPCNLDRVLLAEFHGELYTPPPLPGAPDYDPTAIPVRGARAGRKETNQDQVTSSSQLLLAKRGPFELVRDKSRASDPLKALVYTPGNPPVLEVVAGRLPKPQSKSPPLEPKFHRTHLSIQVPRAKWCHDEVEETRTIRPTSLERRQAMLTGAEALPIEEVLLRRHPMLDLRVRKAGTLGVGKLGSWRFDQPPVPDVRANAALPDDKSVTPPLPPDYHGEGYVLDALKPGEDETTQKDFATLHTISLEPPPQYIERLSRMAVPRPPEGLLTTAMGPIDTAMQALGMGPVGDTSLGDDLLSLGIVTNPDEPDAPLFDPVTGRLLGWEFLPIGKVVQMVSFAATKPKEYLVELQTCGEPDPDDEKAAPACREMQCIVRVFPSNEYNFFYHFKPLADELKFGADGQYIKPANGEGEKSLESCGKMDSTEKMQEEKDQAYEDRQQELQDAKTDERAKEVDDPNFVDKDVVDGMSYQDQQTMNYVTELNREQTIRDIEYAYRDEIVTAVRPQFEGRYGGTNKQEKTGSDEPDMNTDALVSDTGVLAYKYKKVLKGDKTREVPDDGWHGGHPPGAPFGWKPPKEAGEGHRVKSMIYHPIPPALLQPIPPGSPPPDAFALMQQTAQQRMQEHNEWWQGNQQEAMGHGQDQISTEQEGVDHATQAVSEAPTSSDPLDTLVSGFEQCFVRCTDSDNASEMLDTITKGIGASISTVRSIVDIISKVSSDVSVSYGWGVRFELGLLEGNLVLYWGWKEDDDSPRVFRWFALQLDLVIISLRFMLDVGFRLVCGFIRFELIAFLKIQLDASIKGGIEKQGPDMKMSELGWVDTWLLATGKISLGLRLCLIHENVLFVQAQITTGFEMKYRIALPDLEPGEGQGKLARLGVEYEVYFLGVSVHLQIRIIGGPQLPKIWKLIEGNPPGLPWKRGAFPAAASRSFWNVRADLKCAWNKLLFQRRRILRRFDAWEQVQLAMVQQSKQKNPDGSLKYPLTSIPPGYAYAGEEDDQDKRDWWKQNKEDWEAQWLDCRQSLQREAFKVKKGGLVNLGRKVVLGERLAQLCGKVEAIFDQKLRPMLAELDEVGVVIKELDAKVDQTETTSDLGGTVDKELAKAARNLVGEKVLNWAQTINNRPLDKLDSLLRRIAYYYPMREAW